MTDIIWVILILISLVLYLIALIFLFGIKVRTKNSLGHAMTWLIFSVITCSLTKVVMLMEEFYILRIEYLPEILALASTIFILAFGIIALNEIKNVINSKP